tara:strand:- start:135 stop:320 length:186 start_codon:yes stop_codon:yes gene_type:complete
MSDSKPEENEVILTKHELWMSQAPCTNFEYNKDQLLKHALKRGFVTEVGDDQYLINNNYGE